MRCGRFAFEGRTQKTNKRVATTNRLTTTIATRLSTTVYPSPVGTIWTQPAKSETSAPRLLSTVIRSESSTSSRSTTIQPTVSSREQTRSSESEVSTATIFYSDKQEFETKVKTASDSTNDIADLEARDRQITNPSNGEEKSASRAQEKEKWLIESATTTQDGLLDQVATTVKLNGTGNTYSDEFSKFGYQSGRDGVFDQLTTQLTTSPPPPTTIKEMSRRKTETLESQTNPPRMQQQKEVTKLQLVGDIPLPRTTTQSKVESETSGTPPLTIKMNKEYYFKSLVDDEDGHEELTFGTGGVGREVTAVEEGSVRGKDRRKLKEYEYVSCGMES